MKIALVITRSDTIGGAHVHVRDLAVGLAERGIDATLFVGGKGPYTDLLKESYLAYHSLRHLKRELDPIADVRALRELMLHSRCFNLPRACKIVV